MTEKDDDIIAATVPKGLFDPLDRPLTPEEKACPMTFFGIPYQVRKERLEATEGGAAGRTDWTKRAQELRAAGPSQIVPPPSPRPRMKP